MLDELWVRDCMTRDVVTCAADTNLEEVVLELQNRLFSCLVVELDRRPIGIITERDLIGILSGLLDHREWRKQKVERYMTSNPRTLYEDLTLLEAVDQMRLDNIRHAPIVNSQLQLVGILTQTDIINGLYRAGMAQEAH